MPDWIVAGVSVLALAISCACLAYSRRQANEARRANELLERQLRWQEEQHLAEAVQWRVERSGDLLFLRNTGHQMATDVAVELDEELRREASTVPRGDVTLASGQAAQMLIPDAWGMEALTELRVTWRGCAAPAHVPVPPA